MELVPKPKHQSVISTKLLFKNKMNKNVMIVRNKVCLAANRYCQKEMIDFDETSTPVERLETIRIPLMYTTYKDLKVFQVDVKSTFINGLLEEEVYVEQPPGFSIKGLED